MDDTVKQVTAEYDSWEGVDWEMVEHPITSLSDVDALVEKLDGKKHTKAHPYVEETKLLVGGDPEKYVVMVPTHDEWPALANCDSDPNEQVEVVVGGQVGDFDSEIVVERERAKTVARAFAAGRDVFEEYL